MNSALRSKSTHNATPRPVEQLLQVLVERGASHESHGHDTVLRHLTGTHAVLTGWGQPERVCLAGLLHNAYSTEGFEWAMFLPSEREEVRKLIGPNAEQLVHQFGGLLRNELFRALQLAQPGDSGLLTLPDRRGGPPIELTSRDVGDLLVLYLANVADQASMNDGGPTYWLASASELAGLASRWAEVVPPIFDHCRDRVTTADEEHGLEAYDTALRLAATDRAAAIERLQLSSRHLPSVGEPLILLAALYFNEGRAAAIGPAARSGAALIQTWGTPWDKRLSLDDWISLAKYPVSHENEKPSPEVLSKALDAVTASPRDLVLALSDRALPSREVEEDKPTLSSRFRRYLTRHASDQGRRVGIGMYPGLTARPWHAVAKVPVARALESSAREIAHEFSAIRPELLHDEAEDIERTGRWSVLLLEEKGVRRDDVCDLCPATAAVLDTYRGAFEGAGVAYFSCLDPGTRIAPHRGSTNTRLRLHLGLEVPRECGLSVGGIDGRWQEGRCLIFDDSFVHSAWNLSSRRRVVLIVDIWHPDLSPDEIALLQWLGG